MNKNGINFENVNKQRNDDAKYISYKQHKLNHYNFLVRRGTPVVASPDIVKYRAKK
jgi:hypothetical protein